MGLPYILMDRADKWILRRHQGHSSRSWSRPWERDSKYSSRLLKDSKKQLSAASQGSFSCTTKKIGL